MNGFPVAIFAVTLILAAGTGVAADYQRLHADLDGDGKFEIVVLSTAGSGDFHTFSVQIGAETYAAKFFAVERDLPQLSLIVIDRRSLFRQLLVTTFEAASCNYHILGYSHGKLFSLLQFSSDGDCDVPQAHGNGTLSVKTWEGFWRREITYRLNSTGTKLTAVPQQVYAVDATGAAAKDSMLEPANCEKKALTAGEFVRIEKFDSIKHRYLVKGYGGACGWIKEDEVRDYLDEVPWGN
jgi:hypothetical protein